MKGKYIVFYLYLLKFDIGDVINNETGKVLCNEKEITPNEAIELLQKNHFQRRTTQREITFIFE